MRVIHAYHYPRRARFTISRINLDAEVDRLPRQYGGVGIFATQYMCMRDPPHPPPGVREADTYDCFKRGIHHRRFLFDANVGRNALTSFQMDIFIGHRPDTIARPNERQTYHKSCPDRDLDGYLLYHIERVYILFKG